MECPACKLDTLVATGQCPRCGTPVPGFDLETMFMPAIAAEGAGVTILANPMPGSKRTLMPGALAAGSILAGRYKIVKMLGEGGMGAVYKAWDREVDRMVALKVIRPELANQSEILDRFKRELILTRQITHKNVIRIFDLGQADGIRFITMEFVEGRDLRSLERDVRSWSLEKKVKVILQICRALDAAHAEGVVHRDLKPQNIIVEETGRVVVMDFGIAHSMQQAGMTSTGALVGTPAYMSPEQAKGEKVDPRSDLFSLGIVFYELLSGNTPYESETVVGLLLKRIQERPIPPVEHDNAIPQALSDMVLKALAVDKEARYQTAHEIVRDLEQWTAAPAFLMNTASGTTVPAGSRLGLAIAVNGAVTAANQNVLEFMYDYPDEASRLEVQTTTPLP